MMLELFFGMYCPLNTSGFCSSLDELEVAEVAGFCTSMDQGDSLLAGGQVFSPVSCSFCPSLDELDD